MLLVVLPPFVVLILYKMAFYVPSDYQPVAIAPQEVPKVRYDFDRMAQDLYNQSQMTEAFHYRLTQKQVNNILMLWQQEPVWGVKFPAIDQLENPQVRFQHGKLSLLAKVSSRGIEGILTVSIKPELTSAGKLKIRWMPVKMGLLNLPDSLVEDQLQNLLEALRTTWQRKIEDVKVGKKERQQKKKILQKLENLEDELAEFMITKEIVVDSTFKNNDRYLRFEALAIKEGVIDITLQPLMENK